MFKINRPSGFVSLTRLGAGFSHLREHKFRHGFLDIVDPISSCRTNALENNENYFLHWSNFTNQRTVFFVFFFLMAFETGINYDLLDSSTLSRMLLFGNTKFYDNVISGIVYAVLKLN